MGTITVGLGRKVPGEEQFSSNSYHVAVTPDAEITNSQELQGRIEGRSGLRRASRRSSSSRFLLGLEGGLSRYNLLASELLIRGRRLAVYHVHRSLSHYRDSSSARRRI